MFTRNPAILQFWTSISVFFAVVAATVLLMTSETYCGGIPATFMTLDRALPANQKVRLEVLQARDRARHTRMLQEVAAGVVDFPVLGNSDLYFGGIYYTRVKLGCPPKEFSVQIDTGSDILWVTCNACTDCPQSSGLGIALSSFDAANSTTASLISCSDSTCASVVQTTSAQCLGQSNQCGYSFRYRDGSGTSGFYVSDLLHFDTITGDLSVANSSALITFGCSTYQSGDLTKTDKAINGIFGLNRHDLSVISQLASRGITPKVFSHCLRGGDVGGGKLFFGAIMDPSIVYTPLVPSELQYLIYLQSIAVNGQLLPIDPAVFARSVNGGTMVDSGTTLAYLVEEAYDPLVSAITAAVSQTTTPNISKGNHCYLVPTSVSINEIFPPVALNFAGGASMVLRPEDYLLQDGLTWCIGFLKIQDPRVIAILGDLVLKDKILVYDLAHQRVGWADYDCSSLNVSITTAKDEFNNAGQLSVSSSKRNMLISLILTCVTLLVHTSLFTERLLL
ncbi:Nepenthesin [Bertholletia excelsa]